MKKIHPCGIKILGRVFYGRCLNAHVGEKLLVKYDPYDTSQIKVLIADSYVNVPCSQNISDRDTIMKYIVIKEVKKALDLGLSHLHPLDSQ